jgi:nicotinamidase-related amidase
MADSSFDPRQTALILELMQNDFIHPSGTFGRNGIERYMEPLVPTIRRACEASRAVGLPIIATKLTVITDRLGKAVGMGHLRTLRPLFEHEGLRDGTWGHEVVDDLPRPDLTVRKWTYSSFHDTPLDRILRSLGVRCLVFTGGATNIAVDTSARDAVVRGYDVVTLSDCVYGTRQFHDASLVNLAVFGEVITSREFVERIGGSATT